MPLSVTCSCGARLEIDEKFLGKEIPCPDCQRPLPTKAATTPPPLDPPAHRRVSGLALLSLTFSLVGAFTLIGSVVGVVLGILASREIARHPDKIEGQGFALAGIGLGGFFSLLTLILLLLPSLFGLDVVLREMTMVGRVQYLRQEVYQSDNTQGDNVEIKRPSEAWGKFNSTTTQTLNKQTSDLMMLVNVLDDAYIACMNVSLELGEEKGEELEKKVLENVYKSELVNLLGRLGQSTLNREGTIVERKTAGTKHEIILDLRLGGIDRRFLIEYEVRDLIKLNIFVAAARKNRFERFQKTFRDAFESAKFKN